MHTETPYSLYLKFLKPAESVPLIISLESLGLLCLGEERIDETFSIVHYHFANDPDKKTVLHVEIEDSASERINISLYNGVDNGVIGELFAFLAHFDPDKTVLIDQEIKNSLYIKSSGDFSEKQAAVIEQQATLSLSFDDFYNNPLKIARRSQLFGILVE